MECVQQFEQRGRYQAGAEIAKLLVDVNDHTIFIPLTLTLTFFTHPLFVVPLICDALRTVRVNLISRRSEKLNANG
jgi:hypothetical protein